MDSPIALAQFGRATGSKFAPLREAILACGGTATSQIPQLEAAMKQVPADVARMAALALAPMPEACKLRLEAFSGLAEAGVPLETTLNKLAPEALNFALSYDLGPHTLELIDKIHLDKLALASQMIAQAVEPTAEQATFKEAFSFRMEYALGRIGALMAKTIPTA